jgi:hypothetical protein
MGFDACFEINVFAGIVRIARNDNIDSVIERAMAERRIIASHVCAIGGGIRK